MTATNETRAIGNKAGAIGGAPASPFSVQALNLPNCITVSRLVLSFVLFAMISYGEPRSQGHIWIWSTVVFGVAALTDFLDGYLARRYGLVTTLGRILDPFVDKIIVCGAFIFLSAKGSEFSGVGPWMVLIVIGREMFVTGLRSFLEQQGKDFSASLSGKLKMFAQCIAVGASLLSMNPVIATTLPWFAGFRDCLLWLAVAITLISGIIYIRRASQLLRSS